MEQVSIRTTQNVSVDYEVASLFDRGMAWMIDIGIFLLYYLVVIMGILVAPSWADDPFYMITITSPIWLYDMVMEILANGQSVGKMAMKIKVIKVDGTQPSIGSYILRNLLRFVDSLLWFWSIGAFTILATGTGQRLGDLVAGTTVVRTTRKRKVHDTILHRLDPNYQPSFPQVVNLTDRDVSTIRDVMIICSRTRNWEALRLVSNRTKEVMGIQSKMPDFQFLNTVIKDYTNYNFD